jgi:hypothetical protein
MCHWSLQLLRHANVIVSTVTKIFMRLATKLFAQGAIKFHPARVGEGYDGILAGFDDMRQGKVSAQKLVYKL